MRLITFRLDQTWIALFLSVLAIVFLGLTYFVLLDSSSYFVRFMLWYTSLIAVTIVPVTKYLQSTKLLSRSGANFIATLTETRESVRRHLKTQLIPRIDFCEGLDEVCKAAARVIQNAHKERHHEFRYVTFYGAAALAIPETEYEEYGSTGGSGQQSPYQQYLGAIEAATGDKVRFRRYIRLFSKEEFSHRGYLVQREYVNWLKSQFNLLSRNPNYVIAHVVRAPQWGSNLARIITHGAMMEITGDGDAGIVITDDHFCETVRRYARDTVIGSKFARNSPQYFGQGSECTKSLQDFWIYLRGCEDAIPKRASGDEENAG